MNILLWTLSIYIFIGIVSTMMIFTKEPQIKKINWRGLVLLVPFFILFYPYGVFRVFEFTLKTK